MARLNISLPDDLYKMADKWRHRVNLSEICARALRSELEAAESHRSAQALFSALRSPSPLESRVASLYGLSEVIVSETACRTEDVREQLGVAAATYLNRYLCDDSLLAIGGGRQMWCVVRNMTPRQVRLTITALGVRQNDPQVLHAHANTLSTLLWLLYSPRAKAQLVGEDVEKIWKPDLSVEAFPKHFVLGSCGPFDANSYLARLLGKEISTALLKRHTRGDFLYQFFDKNGELLPPLTLEHQSMLSAESLRQLSQRADTRIVLVAGGSEKLRTIEFTLRARLCNVLVTDLLTARKLLGTDLEDV